VKGSFGEFMDAAQWEAARTGYALGVSAIARFIDGGWNVLLQVHRHQGRGRIQIRSAASESGETLPSVVMRHPS
jgi:hypothetical protein